MSQKFWAILKKPKVTTTQWLCKANPPPGAWRGLAQAAQGSCGCPILGGAHDQAGGIWAARAVGRVP